MRRRHVLIGLVLVAGVLVGCVDSGGDANADRFNATMIDVIDGDTVDVRLADGSTDTVRLLGVDTPEVHVSTDPAAFEGVPNTSAARECLRSMGENATRFTADLVDHRDVVLKLDHEADRRGGYDRLVAYVYRGQTHVNERLLETGYARVYVSEFTRLDRFRAAAASARAAGRGVWRCAT